MGEDHKNTSILSVLVRDQPGVLARISALFSRRGFNITSLAVGGTEQKDISRMTIVAELTSSQHEQLVKQLHKIIDVLKIVELTPDRTVARQVMLIKIHADHRDRGPVIETVNLFRAKVVDVSAESLVIEATGTQHKLEAMLSILEPFGIREIAQSGVIATSRGVI